MPAMRNYEKIPCTVCAHLVGRLLESYSAPDGLLPLRMSYEPMHMNWAATVWATLSTTQREAACAQEEPVLEKGQGLTLDCAFFGRACLRSNLGPQLVLESSRELCKDPFLAAHPASGSLPPPPLAVSAIRTCLKAQADGAQRPTSLKMRPAKGSSFRILTPFSASPDVESPSSMCARAISTLLDETARVEFGHGSA